MMGAAWVNIEHVIVWEVKMEGKRCGNTGG